MNKGACVGYFVEHDDMNLHKIISCRVFSLENRYIISPLFKKKEGGSPTPKRSAHSFLYYPKILPLSGRKLHLHILRRRSPLKVSKIFSNLLAQGLNRIIRWNGPRISSSRFAVADAAASPGRAQTFNSAVTRENRSRILNGLARKSTLLLSKTP